MAGHRYCCMVIIGRRKDLSVALGPDMIPCQDAIRRQTRVSPSKGTPTYTRK